MIKWVNGLPRHYSLWDACILVVATTNLWNRGVTEGSAFMFWFSLITVFVFLIPVDWSSESGFRE